MKSKTRRFLLENINFSGIVALFRDIPTALRRLKLAEQNLDLASIYTIHGFCRRMLMQHAFNSGVHFNLKLLKDQSDLLKQFANEFWREHFYDLPFHLAVFISKELKSPEEVLNDLGSNIGNDFSIQLNKPELLELSLKEFLQKDITKNAEIIEKIKDTWLESAVEIRNLFDEEVVKKRNLV